MDEIYEFLNNCNEYFLATIDNDKPRVRPFGTVMLFEHKIYIQTGKNKNVYKQILENPNAELCAYKDGKWIRIEGMLIPDDRLVCKKAILDKYPSLRSMYDENDDNTIVLYFKDATATIFSFTEEPRKIFL